LQKNTQALKLLRRYLKIAPQGRMSGEARKLIAELEDLQEKQQQQLELEMPPNPTSTVTGNVDGYETVDLQMARATRDKRLLTAGTISMGLGGAGVVAGIVLQILAGKTARSDAEQAGDYDEYQRLDDERKSYQIGAVVCFAVGAVAIGAGVAMIMVAKKGERARGSDIKISLVPGLGGVRVVGRF
jgi:F0F1-type ATP synthase membrane subunit c/vacuolar-type H+-ATPase subunit K